MSIQQYVLRSVYGAWRFALMDKTALGWFDLTAAGFWRSFGAALIVAPFYFLVTLAPAGDSTMEQSAAIGLSASLLIYVTTWVAFPLLMAFIARMLSLSHSYGSFIIVHNWSQVVIILALLPLNLAGLMGLGEQGVAMAGFLVATGILVYKWFVARTALQTTAFTAVGVVMVDLLVARLVLGLVQVSLMAGA